MADSFQGQAEEKEVTSSSVAHEEEIEVPSSSTIALQNDVILKNIFGFMSRASLKNSRLVNRQWKRISLPICVERSRTIEFILSRDRVRAAREFQRMAALSQVISTSSASFPCRNFKLKCGLIMDPKVDNSDQLATLANFFREIAPIVQQLELNFFVVYGELPGNLQFPQLKQLALNDQHSLKGWKPEAEASLIFLKDIIQHSPQLTTLIIILGWGNNPKPDQIIAVIESVHLHKLHSLYLKLFERCFEATHWTRLANIGLKLRFLEMYLQSSRRLLGIFEPEVMKAMANFLSSQTDSLEELDFTYHIGKKLEGIISLPLMEKLKHLKLDSNSDSPNFGFSRISYAKQFPALQSLSLFHYKERKRLDAFLDFRMEPVGTVTSLELPNNLEDLAWVWQAARIFPNVKKLMVVEQTDDVIMASFEAWQKVEELTSRMVWHGDSENPRPVNERNLQALKFLQNLKVLRIRRRLITDQVCRLILLQCGSLRLLDLSKSHTDEISQEMLQEMRDKFSVIIC